MLRVFNSFQMTAAFAALPHVLAWLGTSPFPGAAAAFWLAIAVYIVGYCMITAAIADQLRDFN